MTSLSQTTALRMASEKTDHADEKVIHDLKPVPTDGSVREPAQDYEEPIEIDPAMEARVRRKIDLVVLPIFGLIFMFQYLDKVSATARTSFRVA